MLLITEFEVREKNLDIVDLSQVVCFPYGNMFFFPCKLAKLQSWDLVFEWVFIGLDKIFIAIGCVVRSGRFASILGTNLMGKLGLVSKLE